MGIDGMPVQMTYEDYTTLKSGNHPTAQAEVMDNILKGKTYVVSFKGTEHQITIGSENHLRLVPYDPPRK